MTNPANSNSEQYRPTEKQIHFFFSVILSKSIPHGGERLTRTAAMTHYRQADSAQGVSQVSENLGQWGGAVTALQSNDERTWQLLLLQTEKSVTRKAYGRGCADRLDLISLAVADSTPKVFDMLGKMVPARAIESAEDAVGLAVDQQETLRGTYDFGVPFYGYTNRISQNAFIDLLRQEQKNSERHVDIDNLAHTLFAPEQWLPEEVFAAAEQALARKVEQLFEAIYQTLSDVKKTVILHTLAMRPQFWHLLKFLEITPPADLPQAEQFTDDDRLAEALGMTVNAVRVNRRLAKAQIAEATPALAMLLELLLAAR